MRVTVLGGSGFIGPRVMRRLVEHGHDVYCMDINPNAAALDPLRDQVEITHGDVTLMDDVVEALAASKPDRVLNLAYALGASEADPHPQVRLNILGMDHCFEAARILSIRRVIYASSLAVYGPQRLHGDRAVTEDDLCLGRGIYAVSKIFNEHQAEWYNRAYDMAITGVRPANITGPDKQRGSMNHVQCQVLPARGEPVTFPHADAMTLPLHVEDIAEVFVRVTLAEQTAHAIYNSGGHATSLRDLAEIVHRYLPDAEINFEHETGGYEGSGLHRMDNARLVEEFEVEYAPFEQRVLETINAVRSEAGQPPLG